MNRKQLEECAWSKTPADERRSQKDHYDWKTKTTTTKRLKGNAREVRVFDPSGHTPGSMSPFVPLWSLYSDELEQRCKEEVEPKLRAPYNRMRADYTGDVESSPGNRATAEGISPTRQHATRKSAKKSPAQLEAEIAEAKLRRRAENSTWRTFSDSLTPDEYRTLTLFGKTAYGFWYDAQTRELPTP